MRGGLGEAVLGRIAWDRRDSAVRGANRPCGPLIEWKRLFGSRCPFAAAGAQNGRKRGGCEYLGTAPWDFHWSHACNIIGNAGSCNGSRSRGPIFGRFWPVVTRGGFGGFFRVTTETVAAGECAGGRGLDAAQNSCENASGMERRAHARQGCHKVLRLRLLLQTPQTPEGD